MTWHLLTFFMYTFRYTRISMVCFFAYNQRKNSTTDVTFDKSRCAKPQIRLQTRYEFLKWANPVQSENVKNNRQTITHTGQLLNLSLTKLIFSYKSVCLLKFYTEYLIFFHRICKFLNNKIRFHATEKLAHIENYVQMSSVAAVNWTAQCQWVNALVRATVCLLVCFKYKVTSIYSIAL